MESKVAWRPWGAEAFEDAAREGKPILLGISAVWCHWCHVMDRTTYADDEVARLVNERFVPVRVDFDQRPDINRRYNMGGWPTTAFLTPTGEILTGGTYFPPETMRSVLQQVEEAWTGNREEIERKVREAAERRGAEAARRTGPVSMAVVERIVGGIASRYDPVHGGFGPAPKFPHALALQLLLDRSAATGDEALRRIGFHTLEAMAGRGMYDHVEGGFFRYSTNEDWSVPHFEKMTEDNARLLLALLKANALPGGERFGDVARDVFRYVGATLTDPEGGFRGSQDADEEYYAADGEGRAALEAPFVDPTIYADRSALMTGAHLQGGAVLGDASLREQGLSAIDRVLSTFDEGEGLAHHLAPDGPGEVRGLLADHAEVGLAALDAYQHTGERTYLERAEALAAFARTRLAAPEGGFVDRPPDASAEGALRDPVRPLEDNAAMATLLLRLGRLLRKDELVGAARDTLASMASGVEMYDLFGASFALAAAELSEEPVHVTVVGAQKDALPLAQAALESPQPGRLAQVLDPGRDADLVGSAGFPVGNGPLAYVCVGERCLAPTSSPAEVRRLVADPTA